MNQFFANLRRVLALLAAVSLLSGLTPARSRAQADPKPAEPAPAATTEAAADTTQPVTAEKPAEKTAKKTKASKAPKVAKAKAAPAVAVTKPAKTPKPAKEKPVKAPEKSFEEMKKEDGVYAKGSNWLSLRFGWAKRTGELAGDGFVGYGLGYQHMISRRYAFGAGVGHDVVGHFGQQIDEAVPFTAEFQRHFRWKSVLRPYVGLGGGYYLRKNYRTAGEYTTTATGGPHVSLGFTSALDDKHVIGLEARVARLQGRTGVVNPTFGPGENTETMWTIKGSWALVY